MNAQIASLYEAVDLNQSIKPLIIGERCNTHGSKKFKNLLLEEDYESCLSIARDQEAAGAHVIDLCVAYAGRDEVRDMKALVPLMATGLKAPIMIDSTTPEVIEEALKIYPGRCIINSVNLEDGGTNLYKILPLVKQYGAAVVALTIDEEGMAMSCEKKLAIAKRIHKIATEEIGLRSQDILFDPLTFTVGAGDENLVDAAIQTLDAIRAIKAELPGCFTMLGLSNISFGLSKQSRKILNAMFLHEALEAGLDACIIDAAKMTAIANISPEDREISLDLLYHRIIGGEESPLIKFINHFTDRKAEDETEEKKNTLIEEQIFTKVLKGDKEDLDDLLSILLERLPPLQIINNVLIPAMRQVGELFGAGEILLPFVLQSAETMKTAVNFLEPLMERQESEVKTKVLLATVQGDVHDIGKNLVDIILSNNGYKVYNIGIKTPIQTIIQKAKEYDVDVIGLSGLLVKSAIVMKESMVPFKEAGLTIPIFLGGAALSPRFVATECVPIYDGKVVYNKDAFDALASLQAYEAGSLESCSWEEESIESESSSKDSMTTISRDFPTPQPPFWGSKIVEDIDLKEVLALINKSALFRGRWGYKKGKLSDQEYKTLLQEKAEPLYESFVSQFVNEGLIKASVSYGYFKCQSQENNLIVENEGSKTSFTFPRQRQSPSLCLSDYFHNLEEGEDVASFFVVTIGHEVSKRCKALYEAGEFHDYMMLHAFSVEITEALAEYWHKKMRQDLGIDSEEKRKYQGCRYGFGYSSCPDLAQQSQIFELLKPERIGVSLTQNYQMVPEQSTSALIAHHPDAKYFMV